MTHMNIEWHKQNELEVQIWRTGDRASARAVLFCPGFPGVGGSLFEQRHAGALALAGYDVHVIHHAGTRIDGPYAPMMVNNSARLQSAYQAGETHLGGGAATMDQWMVEPLSWLRTYGDAYADIRVIGNSYGALSSLWSITADPDAARNVKGLLLLAGAQGVWTDSDDSLSRLWRYEFIATPRITDRVEFRDLHAVIATLKQVYTELPDRVRNGLAADIRLTYLVVEQDEILHLSDTQAFRDAVGGRGDIVIDSVDHPWPDAGLSAHDTPNYRTEDLLKLIAG